MTIVMLERKRSTGKQIHSKYIGEMGYSKSGDDKKIFPITPGVVAIPSDVNREEDVQAVRLWRYVGAPGWPTLKKDRSEVI
jgi:hypothetical protein